MARVRSVLEVPSSLPRIGVRSNSDHPRCVWDQWTDRYPIFQSFRPYQKGRSAIIAPARLGATQEDGKYLLLTLRLILAHVERQFKFNLVTWRLANAIPLLVAGATFAIWGMADGWKLHQSDDVLPAVAGIIALTALALTLWRLVVIAYSANMIDAGAMGLTQAVAARNPSANE